MKSITHSTLNLFNAIPIKDRERKNTTNDFILEKTIPHGFIFSRKVLENRTNKEITILYKEIKNIIGLDAEKINSSFHKSWKKIKEADIEQLVIEQIIHYFTTYGAEYLGIDMDEVYIPDEVLELPDTHLPLKIIHGYTKDEIKEKLLNLLNSGIALKKETIDDCVNIALFIDITTEEIETLKNKETKVILFDLLNKIPKNPIEFLRFCIYKATDTTLIIKNNALIEKIKEKKNIDISRIFDKYKAKYGFEKLAEIFYRYKPIFLAFRTNPKLKKDINKIRKLAIRYHKPMPEDYLNTVTARVRHDTLDLNKLEEELKKVNIFRKIRLAYALQYRTQDPESILYKIRNGKSFACEFPHKNIDASYFKGVCRIVKQSIADDLQIKNKKVYIPENIKYALPATEKQFTGNIPSGTCIEVDESMLFGIYWNNIKSHEDEHRIDLDLAILSVDIKFGWDGEYRNNSDIMFSGDMTDAKNGASEIFYISREASGTFLVTVNFYNFYEDLVVPFDIFVAKERPERLHKQYLVNPKNVIAKTTSQFDGQMQKMLGVIVASKYAPSKFYFSETYLGNAITSRNVEYIQHARKFLANFYSNTISFNDIIEKAGAKIVNNIEEADIDLSPQNIDKNTFIDILQ